LKPRFTVYLAALTLLVSLIAASAASPAIAGSGVTRQIALAGTGSPTAGESSASEGNLDPELEFPEQEEEATPDAFNGTIDRSLSKGSGSGVVSATAKKAKSNPQVQASFEGLNFYQQRYARNGNQFSVEPPDQGLCVGNGYIVEAVNDVVNIFNSSGTSVLPDNTSTNIVGGFPRNVNHAVDLNSFYGYPPAINRTGGNVRGQFVTDPSCYYDASTQRFFMVVLTLEVVPTSGAFTTVNHLDLAVSQTSNPTGTWNIYRINVTSDGTNTGGTNPGPYLGDYPHIGADANGFYITTNAYPWCCNGFSGAQIYAFSKLQLAAGAGSVTMQHIDTSGMVNAPSDAGPTQPGFTVWPAHSPGTSSYETAAGGTEYFLSSNAADEATHPKAGTGGNYMSNNVVLWALTNTATLNTAAPLVTLSNTLLTVGQYALPPKASQPGSGTAPGINAPQGRCINDTTTNTIAGMGCWRLLFGAQPAHDEVISRIDSNDTRMQQVMYANGKVWGALDTAVTMAGVNHAGVGWYVVKPDVSTGSVTGKIALTGNTGVEGKDIVYPAIGVTASGRGVVAVTLVGPTNFPSAAYAPIDAQAGMGDVQIVAAGAAPDDGFTSYKSQVGNPPRTRWGDYGAAAVDGNSVWIASEYIAQSCDYSQWGGPFFTGGTGDNLLGTCGGASHGPGARAALGNWSTRISKLTP
jgi:hypothetical protein